jgi:rare lipoprotein A
LLWLLPAAAVLASGCSVRTVVHPGEDDEFAAGYARPAPIDPDSIPDAVPRAEPRSRYGNPASYTVRGRTYRVMNDSRGFSERGIASWYGSKFHGRRTSSGEPYDMYQMTAAHKHLPLPSYVQVTNLDNGRQVVVRVNDRGPFKAGRVIDLSYAAATKLGMVSNGTAPVEIRVIEPGAPRHRPSPGTPPTRVAAQRLPGSDGYIYLQAGAFANQTNAELLSGRLRDAIAPPVAVDTSQDPARALYRVRLGPLESVEQAVRLAAELDRLGVNGARVIID